MIRDNVDHTIVLMTIGWGSDFNIEEVCNIDEYANHHISHVFQTHSQLHSYINQTKPRPLQHSSAKIKHHHCECASGHKQSQHHPSLQHRLDDTFHTFQNSPVSFICVAARYILIVRRYDILQPILQIFFKSPEMAMQSVPHAPCLPMPFKVLKPGTLYRECSIGTLQVSAPEKLALLNLKTSSSKKGNGKAGEEVLEIPDDGHYGGEVAGRLVWEAYKEALKVWEKENLASEDVREEERKQKQTPHRDHGPEALGVTTIHTITYRSTAAKWR